MTEAIYHVYMTTTNIDTIVILPFENETFEKFDLFFQPYYTNSKMLNQDYKLRYYTSGTLVLTTIQ